jgi:hypothetical protein
MKKCPYCPCEFEANSDFQQHMETFGYDKEMHLTKYYRIHGLPDPRYTIQRQASKPTQTKI